MVEQLNPIEIETESKSVEDLVKEMIKHLYEAGFHTKGFLSIGQWEAFQCQHKKTGRLSILYRVIDKLDFMWLGADEEYFKKVEEYFSAGHGLTIYYDVEDMSAKEVIQKIEEYLYEISILKDKKLKHLNAKIIEMTTDNRNDKTLFALDAGDYRFAFVGADQEFIDQFYKEILND